MVQEHLKSSWDQFVSTIANDKYTRQRVNLRQVLSHTWGESGLLPLHVWCIRWEWKKKNVHRNRIIGYGYSCNLHQSYVYTMPRKSST